MSQEITNETGITAVDPTSKTETATESAAAAEAKYALECARARGDEPIPDDEPGQSILAAHCDYSARGKMREHWFRMAWRNDTWEYIGERLSGVGIHTHTRHQSSYADVWPGELIAQHDRGKPIDIIWLVVLVPDSKEPIIRREKLQFTRRRDGKLAITLPDGTVLTRPDPRR
jgi:hypothetical protein